MPEPALETRWKLTATPSRPAGLELELVVNTLAPGVVADIERAAARAGVELERLETEAPAGRRSKAAR